MIGDEHMVQFGGTDAPQKFRPAVERRVENFCTGQGAYQMRSGEKQVDQCAQVWIVVDEEDEQELKKMGFIMSLFANYFTKKIPKLKRWKNG